MSILIILCLDGMSSISGLYKAAKTGMNVIALTDHGNMFGVKEFFNYVKKENLKPKTTDKNKGWSWGKTDLTEDQKPNSANNSPMQNSVCSNQFLGEALMGLQTAVIPKPIGRSQRLSPWLY